MNHPCLLAVAAVVVVLAAPAPSAAADGDAFLDASSFTALAASFDPGSDVTVDLSDGQMSGGSSFTGVLSNGNDGTARWVFTFGDFTLAAGVTITFVNGGTASDAVAFLSQTDMTLAGTIEASGANGVAGGAGGGGGPDGGNGGGQGSVTDASPGDGPGGGQTAAVLQLGGGGGAFGGAGGDGGGASGTGGTTSGYDSNGLISTLQGGSGGAGGTYFSNGVVTVDGGGGGGGGGAVQLGALGTLTFNGFTMNVAGGLGAGSSSSGSGGGGGGGSGGGVLVQAGAIVQLGANTFTATGGGGGLASGGPGMTPNSGGGGGGGGRIEIYYHDTITGSGTLNTDVSGGPGGEAAGDILPGGEAALGFSTFAQSSLVPTGVPEPAFSAAGLGAVAMLAALARRRASRR